MGLSSQQEEKPWGCLEAEHQGDLAAVGIDLGTSYTRMGIWKQGDVHLIPNERGELKTPSCIAFSDEGVLFGEEAVEQAEEGSECTVFAPQRLVGFKSCDHPCVRMYMRTWPSRLVRGEDGTPVIRVLSKGEEHRLRPEDILTMLLVHLRKVAESHLGKTVLDAVITVPSRYGKAQREAVIEACRSAQLNVIDFINAPTAAAVAYCLTSPRRERRNVLVCNMGGSYFDFSLLCIEDCVIVERAIGTDYIDLDNCLLRYCMQDLREKWSTNIVGQSLSVQRLREKCEVAKKMLSTHNQARIEVTNLIPDTDYFCTISRVHFEELCKDDIGALLDPISWSLEDSGLEKGDIDEVVLVGGSARVPAVRRALQDFFYGKKPHEVMRPEHAAVLGAAAYSALLVGAWDGEVPQELRQLEVKQVTPWSSLPGDGEGECEGRDGGPPPPKPSVKPQFKEPVRPALAFTVLSSFGDDAIPGPVSEDRVTAHHGGNSIV